jgi:hypothetical protein
MAGRKPKSKETDRTTPEQGATVHPSASEMIETALRESDEGTRDKTARPEESRDTEKSRRSKRSSRSAWRQDPVGIAAGVCLFGGDGGRPLLRALGLIESRRDRFPSSLPASLELAGRSVERFSGAHLTRRPPASAGRDPEVRR